MTRAPHLCAAAAALLLAVAAASGAEEPAAAAPPAPASAESRSRDVHPALGVGVAFRSDKVTGKLVPASVTWKDDRYEFFVAYFRDQEISGFRYQGYPAHEGLAPPLWAFALSRRFAFVDRSRFKAFLGVGVAWLDTHPCQTPDEANDHTPRLDYNEPVYHGCDKLNGSRLNYALQLGARLYNRDRSQGLEVSYRHISNAGMTSGNRGEDFVSALLVF